MTRASLQAAAAFVAAVLSVAGARAQEAEDFTGNQPSRGTVPVRAFVPGRGTGEVTLTIRSFGLGDRARPGEWTAVLVDVNDSSDKVRNVMVHLGAQDLDGDKSLMQRVIVTNPGSTQQTWLYTRLPLRRSRASTSRRGRRSMPAAAATRPGTPPANSSAPSRTFPACLAACPRKSG